MKIGIVTDTGCNITPKEAEELNIHLVPLELIFEDESYLDGVELSTEEFYKKMRKSNHVPTSSQPTYGAFYELYEKIIDDYDKIISIHLSSDISGAVETAQMVANEIDSSKIEIFDTKLVSLLSRNLVLEAKKQIDEGKAYEEIIETLKYGRERSVAYILFGSLDNVTKSGRVPGLVGKLADMIQIKPIVKVSTEGFEIEKAVRTSKRASRAIEKLVSTEIEALDYPTIVEYVYGDVIEKIEEMRKKFIKKHPEQDNQIHRLAGVVGVHAGPDMIGYSITPDYSKIS